MKVIFNFCCGFLVSLSALSQDKIVLKPIAFFYDSSTFYVQKVIDNRTQKSLGTIDGSQLHLAPDPTMAIQEFMDVCFPKLPGLSPIIIKINELNVQKTQTNLSDITVRVHIDLTFFEHNGTVLKELYTIQYNEDQIFSDFSNKEILKTHEKRIRASLEYCMRSFIYHTQIQEIDTNSFFENAVYMDIELVKWYNILLFKKIYSSNIEGWKISYTGFVDRQDDFIIPVVFTFDQYRVKPEILNNRKIKSINTYSFSGGIDGFLKLFPGVYVGIGAEVPVGVEVIRGLNNNKLTNFLIGIHAKEGVRIMPWKNYGIVMGAYFLQTFQTSKVYNSNTGFEIEVGINF